MSANEVVNWFLRGNDGIPERVMRPVLTQGGNSLYIIEDYEPAIS
jgi:hypothetical protein